MSLPEGTTPARILMGPGPSNIHHRVYAALAQPVVGHMDGDYVTVMDETQDLLRGLFVTTNALTLALPVTGMGAMEACLANLIEPGARVVVGVQGVFGSRMANISGRLGAEVHAIDTPWGRPTSPEDVLKAVKDKPTRIVGLVHGETSTGVLQTQLPEIAAICKEHGALLLVDTVASLGGAKFMADEWGIDVVYTGSQKCLSVPPGISPVTLNDRAEKIIAERKSPCPSWYMDLTILRNYWEGEARAYHHTGPVNMTYALREGLRLIDEEGVALRWGRHQRAADALYAGCEAMGLKLFVEDKAERCPTLTTVCVPEGADDAAARKALLSHHSLEIGGGLGALAGKVWRVGLMGEGARPNHVLLFLAAIGGILEKQGVKIDAGAGVAAAGRVINA